MKYILNLGAILLFGCVHTPKCGNPEGARVVFDGTTTCSVRIRQVEVGSHLKIPESLKNPELALMELTWIDPVFANGQVIMGHFKLMPKSQEIKK